MTIPPTTQAMGQLSKSPWVNNSPSIPTSGQQWFFQLLFNCLSVKLQDLQACTILRKKSSAFIKNTFMALNLSRYSLSCIILCLRTRNVLQKNARWHKELAILLRSPCDGSKRFRYLKRPALVKDLIRLVKYWRKTYIPKSGSKHVPPSYLLELLTIHVWENVNPLNPAESFDMKIGFKAVLEVLKNHQSLRVSWEDYYRRDLIPNRYIHGEFKIVLLQ